MQEDSMRALSPSTAIPREARGLGYSRGIYLWLGGLHPGSASFSLSASPTSPTGTVLSDRHVASGMGPQW